MRREILFMALLLGGCSSSGSFGLDGGDGIGGDDDLASARAPAVKTTTCEGPRASQCTFINSPVKLASKPLRLPDSPFPFYRTRNELKFVDAAGTTWIAPAGTLTDGASIPPLFVPFIGNPRSRQFMNPATVHDAYCAESNRDGPYYHTARWQKVHRMFYDGLLASGTSPVKAKIMYAAVYLGGPRWSEVRQPPVRRAALERTGSQLRVRLAGGALSEIVHMPGGEAVVITATAGIADLRAMQSNVPLTKLVPRERLIAAFKQAKAYIEANNPPVDDLEVYLTRLEQDLTGASRKKRNFKPTFRTDRDELGGGEGGNESGGHDAGGDTGGNSDNLK